MSKTMVGRRVEFVPGWPGDKAQPGDYCKVPPGFDPRGEVWYAMAPNGHIGALAKNHTIVEHEDNTITVSPSIVMPSGWHGWLNRGVWKSV